jgi:hypothetical protein
MRPAECKLNIAALGELAIAGIAIDLQDPLEACEMDDRLRESLDALRKKLGVRAT